MTTTPFRELPQPSAITLSHSPRQSRSALGRSQFRRSMGHLPDHPPRWQESEDSMGNWLLAKAEEDKLRQEEEKTRQEALKLEQRKVEQEMLNTSLREGIPPFLIPMFFAGISGSSSPNACTEMYQNQLAQVNHLQQQHQISLQQSQLGQAPILSNKNHQTDSRSGQHFTGSILRPLTSNSCSKQFTANGSHLSSRITKNYQMSPASTPRSYQMSQSKAVKLSRLSSEGMNFESINTASGTQDISEKHSSPPIHFHYWHPPTTQTEKSCLRQSTTSSENDSPPKKRKNVKNPLPAPSTTQPQQQQQQLRYTSSFSHLNTSILNPPVTRQPSHTRQINYPLAQEISDYNEPANNQCNIQKSSYEKGTSLQHQVKISTKNQSQVDSLGQSSHSVSNLLEILEPTRESS